MASTEIELQRVVKHNSGKHHSVSVMQAIRYSVYSLEPLKMQALKTNLMLGFFKVQMGAGRL